MSDEIYVSLIARKILHRRHGSYEYFIGKRIKCSIGFIYKNIREYENSTVLVVRIEKRPKRNIQDMVECYHRTKFQTLNIVESAQVNSVCPEKYPMCLIPKRSKISTTFILHLFRNIF